MENILIITKASAYDILRDQVSELKAENERLKERVKYLQDLISETVKKIQST